MQKRWWIALSVGLVVLGLVVLGLVLGGAAWAQAGDTSCVVSIQPYRPGQPVPPVSEPRCFPSLEDALKGLRLEPVRPTPTPSAALPNLDFPLRDGNHCVVNIEPLQPGERFSRIRPVGCFASFSEAIAVATDGALQLPPDWNPADGLPEGPAPAQGNVVVGIDYEGANFTGSTLVWETDHTPGCSDGTSFVAPSMPAGWNDRVSSARSYSGCNHYYHYEHTNFGGAVLDCGGSCSNMGVMDNQTSSERWTR
ncbi:MAG: hypothetical protein H5T61_09450 [Thermoflexales bacterium]|nr:hypothetical protein [Thermoflexales bacterium]